MRVTERGRKAKAYTFKDADKMSAPLTKDYRNNYMYMRDKVDAIIFERNFEELCQIINEVDELKDILPEVETINEHANTFEECEKFLDEVTNHKNFKETDEVLKGYTTRYDMRQAGQYLYHIKGTSTDVYREGLLDKFHKWVLLMYYQAQQFVEDFIEREDIVVPVSACETPWILDER